MKYGESLSMDRIASSLKRGVGAVKQGVYKTGQLTREGARKIKNVFTKKAA